MIAIYTDPNYALVSSSQKKYNKAITPHLYSIPSNTVNIKTKECSKDTHKRINYKNIEICVDSSIYKETKVMDNGSAMITSINPGKQIVIIPATDYSSLLNELNSMKNSINYLERFGFNEIPDIYSYDKAALNITPDNLSILNDYIESQLSLMLLERKEQITQSSNTIYNLAISNISGFQINKTNNKLPVVIHLYKNNSRYRLVFGIYYNQNDINNILSSVKIEPNKSFKIARAQSSTHSDQANSALGRLTRR